MFGNQGGFGRGKYKPNRSGQRARSSASNGGGRSNGGSRGGHWYEGRWYPADAGQSQAQGRRGPAPGRSRAWSDSGERRGEGSFDDGSYGDHGLARRIGFRF